jgi:hypothetical protein
LLSITKASLKDHLDKLRVVLTSLQDAGLPVNAGILSSGPIEMEYLRYIIMCMGIKPQSKKAKAACAISLPQQVKDLRNFRAW